MPTETSEGVGKIHPIMRKQSFYVWFLGAQEARGVRDDLFVRPVLKYLLEREKDVEPTKVTLQVSSKGLKIVQNIVRTGSKAAKKEQMKHLIPPHSLTWVAQAESPHEDIVCCTLLIYNPVTKCPVHVHAYRCDSVETARSLRHQLTQLMEHTQRALGPVDSESLPLSFSPPPQGHIRANRLASNAAHSGAVAAQKQQPIGSDGRSTRTDEEDPDFEGEVDDEIGKSFYEGHGAVGYSHANSGATAADVLSFCRPLDSMVGSRESPSRNAPEDLAVLVPPDPRMVRLYDSLAQELKAKLAGTNGLKCKAQKAPLLLPPKDYDTVCRKQGNLMGIDFRRSTNQSIVGGPNSPDTVIEAVLEGNDADDPSEQLARRQERLLSSTTKNNSGIGSDAETSSVTRSPCHTSAEIIVDETTDDEWNFSRPVDRCELRPEGKLRPRHRSLDFLQQRLDQFHMGERTRTTSSPERPRVPAPHSLKHQSKEAAATYFGQHSIQPLRSLSNNSNSHPSVVLPALPPQSQQMCYAGSGAFSLQLAPGTGKNGGEPSRAATRSHQDRPISFPSGVIPVKRDIPSLTQVSPQRYSFHQHPMKESMIEPLINQHHQQKRRSSPGTRNPFEQFLHLSRKPDPNEAKSAHFAQRLRSPVMGHAPENMKPQPERPPDFRRQSLAEFRDGSHTGRNPLNKYLVNSPLERRAYRSRYSVAESNGHRLY